MNYIIVIVYIEKNDKKSEEKNPNPFIIKKIKIITKQTKITMQVIQPDKRKITK